MDDYIPTGLASRPDSDFSQAKAGRSMWVETNNDRISAARKFKRWAKTTGSNLIVRTVTVGSEDPRGPGFRLVFEVRAIELKPAIRAALTIHGSIEPAARVMLEYTGIFSDQDILDALADEGEVPTTIGHVAAFKHRIFAGTTAYQIAFCRVQGKPTLEEARHDGAQRQRSADLDRQARKPEARRPGPDTVAWADLTIGERIALGRAGIGDATTYAEAFSTFPHDWSSSAVLAALKDGQGEWHAYRVRAATAQHGDFNISEED